MSFIGIDLGGTFMKGAVLDQHSAEMRHLCRRPFPDFIPGGGGRKEVSPGCLLEAFHGLLENLLNASHDCEGMILTGQMHGMIFCDTSGNPKSNFISWQDSRTSLPFDANGRSAFDRLKAMLPDQDWRQLGNEFRAGLPLTQLFLLEQQGHLPQDAYCASLMDFVISNLCKTAPITDASNAEAHGFYNILTGAWDLQLIEHLRLGQIKLPQVKPHFTVAGVFQHKGREIPCYVAIGDQQCALLGSFLEEQEISLNIATGSQVSLISSACETGPYQTRPYFEEKYLKTITHIPAGRALNGLIRLFFESETENHQTNEIWHRIQTEASKIASTDLEVDISFFNSRLGNSGFIKNMKESNMSLGHVFFAAFQSMAKNYHDCAAIISPEKNWKKMVFSGGLVSKSPLLQSMLEDRFQNLPYRSNDHHEDVLQGLMVCAVKICQQGTVGEAQAFVQSRLNAAALG